MTPPSRRSEDSRRWEPDERTVGDLLLDADLTVRELLWDAPPDIAKARARSWGEVVEAAAEVWAAIPDRTGDPSMERIHKLTDGMYRNQQRTGWPGVGAGDPHLERAAEALSRAAEMISARRHPTAPLSEAGHLDSVAARTRIMHTVYVASHGVSNALWQYTRDMRRVLDGKGRLQPGDSADQSQNMLTRVGAAERLAGSYLAGRWPAGLAGQHREVVEPQRLAQAVAAWAVQSRRTWAASPTVADLLYTTITERDLVLSGGRVLQAAAGAGAIDAEQHTARLHPALITLEQAWGRVASELAELTGRPQRINADLLAAGTELRASIREISSDLGGVAGTATMAQRADLHAASLEVQRGVVASVDLGHVVRDVVRDPQLTAPARGVQAMAGRLDADPGDAAWVEAGALLHNRPVPLPPAVRDALSTSVERVVHAAATADSAGSFFDAAHRADSPTAPTAAPTGRARAERTAPTMTPAPGLGCER
ncbi:MAG: hypothetical protein ACYC1E_17495 [Propionibacteriaceae bacterium]